MLMFGYSRASLEVNELGERQNKSAFNPEGKKAQIIGGVSLAVRRMHQRRGPLLERIHVCLNLLATVGAQRSRVRPGTLSGTQSLSVEVRNPFQLALVQIAAHHETREERPAFHPVLAGLELLAEPGGGRGPYCE